MYIAKKLIKVKVYEIIDQFKERKLATIKFYSMLLNKINRFYTGNGGASKIYLLDI